MSDAAFPSDSNAAAADLRARATFDQQLWMLGRLAQAGLNMAVALEAQAIAAQPEATRQQGPQPYGAPTPAHVSLDFTAPTPGELALAFARVSRAVRMTLALQARLLRSDIGGSNAFATLAPAPARRETRTHRANRAGAIVRRLIEGANGDALEAMEHLEQANERLFDPDITGDLLDRPLRDVIAEICQDLGLEPDWAAYQSEAWTQAGESFWPPERGFDSAQPAHPARPASCPAPFASGQEGFAAGP